MKKLLYSALIALTLLLPAFTLCAQTIVLNRIVPERLALVQQKITSDLSSDTLKRRLLYTVGLVACGYMGYKYLYAAQPAEIVPVSADNIRLMTLTLESLRSKVGDFVDGDGAQTEPITLGWLATPLGRFGSYVWGSFKALAYNSAVAYCAGIMMYATANPLGALTRVIDDASFHLFHDRDVRWFLRTRASVTTLFNELESHAQCLETGLVATDLDEQTHGGKELLNAEPLQLTSDSYEHHLRTFENTWNQLLERITSLTAFIELKACECQDRLRQGRMRMSGQQLTATTNATAARLQPVLSQANVSELPDEVHYEVRRLRVSLANELLQVNKLEHI